MKLRITIEGKAYDVDVDVIEDAGGQMAGAVPAAAPAASAPVASAPMAAPAPVARPAAPVAAGAKVFPSPIAGTVRGIKVKPGEEVALNQEMLILEAMKMETSVSAPQAGRIKAILVNIGDAVQAGQGLVEFE